MSFQVYFDGKHYHAETPQNGEFTLCGWAFDAPDSEDDCPYEKLETARYPYITCPECVAIIDEIKILKTRRPKGISND